MDEQRVVLSDLQVEAIATSAAEKATKEVFAILGVDVDKPESVEEFREDLRFGKRLRKAADKSWITFAGVGAGALVYAMWLGAVEAAKQIGGK